MANWLEKTIGTPLKKVWDGVTDVAKLGTLVPGPIGDAAKVITAVDALTRKQENPSANVANYLKAGADAQTAYQMAALDEARRSSNRQISIATADKQMAYDINRGLYQSNQQNILPYQTASLSALQALPQLQQLLGVQAYNVPRTISQYVPPEVDYTKLYGATQEKLFPTTEDGTTTTDGAATTENGGIGTGLRASMRPDYDSAAEANLAASAPPAGTTVVTGLDAYTGPSYDLENSPLFKWQKQQAQEGLAAQLAAAGLSGGSYAQKQLSNQNLQLAAAERDRVVGNLSSLVNMGMGGSSLGQSSFTTPQSTDILNAYQGAGSDAAKIYGNLGNIQGNYNTQLASNYMAGYNAQQQGTTGWQDALGLLSSTGWLNNRGGGSKKTSSSSSAPYTTALGYTLPGEFQLNTNW